MAHLGTRAFEEIGGEVVQTTSFVYLNNYFSSYTGKYIKLTEFDNQAKKEAAYLGLLNGWEKTYSYENNQENFKKSPARRLRIGLLIILLKSLILGIC